MATGMCILKWKTSPLDEDGRIHLHLEVHLHRDNFHSINNYDTGSTQSVHWQAAGIIYP